MKDGNFFIVPNALVDAPGIGPDALAVYASLRRHRNQVSGRCDVSYTHIMEDWGISRKTVAKALKDLKDAGLIISEKQGQRSLYQFPQETSSLRTPVPQGNRIGSPGKPELVSPGDANNTKEQDELTRRNTMGVPKPGTPASEHPPSDAFVIFWAAWPAHFRKEDKAKCASYWRTHKLDLVADAIMAGLSGWKGSEQWQKDSGKWIPGPLPWLRGEKWERPGPPAVPKNGTPTNGQYKTAGEKRDDMLMRFMKGSDDGQPATIRAHITGGGVPPGDPQRSKPGGLG